MKYSLFIVVSLLLSNSCRAQYIHWQKAYGGTQYDLAYDIQPTPDGGFIVVGSSDSPYSYEKEEGCLGYEDYWIIKADANGNIEWQRTIGGEYPDDLQQVVVTSDGGYLLGGFSYSNASEHKSENSQGYTDMWIVKLDADGNILWDNTIGGICEDQPMSMQETQDQGFILGGYSCSSVSGDIVENVLGFYDAWVVKVNSTGNIEWQRMLGGTGSDVLLCVKQTLDGGYILGINSESGISGEKTEANIGATDMWIVKLDPDGEIEWQNTMGGNIDDVPVDILPLQGGGYWVAGYSDSDASGDKSEPNWGYTDIWLIKLDDLGGIVWENTIGGIGYDWPCNILQLNNGSFVIGAESGSPVSLDKTEPLMGIFGEDVDYWVMGLDPESNILWQKVLGGTNLENLEKIRLTPEGDYLLAGRSYSGVSGNKTEDSRGLADFWVVKLGEMPLSDDDIIEKDNILLSPNPVQDILHISIGEYNSPARLIISDLLGHEVISKDFGSNEPVEVDTSTLPGGTYCVNIQVVEKNYLTKFIKL